MHPPPLFFPLSPSLFFIYFLRCMIILLSFIASVDHCDALILENTLIRCNEFAFACHQASGIHVGFTNFSAGGYITGSEAPRIIREAILRLCAELKDEAVSLVDVLAPTDFILNSPIGASDGEVSLVWIPVYFSSFWSLNSNERHCLLVCCCTVPSACRLTSPLSFPVTLRALLPPPSMS